MKKLICMCFAVSLLTQFTPSFALHDVVANSKMQDLTWYMKAKQTERKWGVPVELQLMSLEAASQPNNNPSFSQTLQGTFSRYQKACMTENRHLEFGLVANHLSNQLS